MKSKIPPLLLNLKIMKASIISRLLLIFFISVFSGCSSDSGLSGSDWNFDNIVGDIPTTISRCWAVQEISTELPIEGAKLIVEIQQFPTRTLLTDANGHVCTDIYLATIRKITISASGYQTRILLTGDSATIFLTPNGG